MDYTITRELRELSVLRGSGALNERQFEVAKEVVLKRAAAAVGLPATPPQQLQQQPPAPPPPPATVPVVSKQGKSRRVPPPVVVSRTSRTTCRHGALVPQSRRSIPKSWMGMLRCSSCSTEAHASLFIGCRICDYDLCKPCQSPCSSSTSSSFVRLRRCPPSKPPELATPPVSSSSSFLSIDATPEPSVSPSPSPSASLSQSPAFDEQRSTLPSEQHDALLEEQHSALLALIRKKEARKELESRRTARQQELEEQHKALSGLVKKKKARLELQRRRQQKLEEEHAALAGLVKKKKARLELQRRRKENAEQKLSQPPSSSSSSSSSASFSSSKEPPLLHPGLSLLGGVSGPSGVCEETEGVGFFTADQTVTPPPLCSLDATLSSVLNPPSALHLEKPGGPGPPSHLVLSHVSPPTLALEEVTPPTTVTHLSSGPHANLRPPSTLPQGLLPRVGAGGSRGAHTPTAASVSSPALASSSSSSSSCKRYSGVPVMADEFSELDPSEEGSGMV